MDQLRRLKQQLRTVVTATAPKASKTVYKRENKNRPREVSAKRREWKQEPKIVRRDPRFEESCGHLDEEQFQKDYAFLHEMREQERRKIARMARREKDADRKESLLRLKQRIENQAVSQRQRHEEKQVVQQLKQQAKETTGKTYVKRSEVKAAILIDKFKKLKKSGKLSRYLEKKRKKNASKDRKKIE